jgi:toxin HigB-1
MQIESIRSKSLKAFIETGKPKGIDRKIAGRIRNMIAFLMAARNAEELRTPPNFGFHWLAGDRSGTAAMTLTKNWRMTFSLSEEGSIVDLDLEDYH